MSSEPARLGAYADLVSGLLDARTDPATDRFDAEVAAAVADGAITADAARTLRFWQRASVRAVADHARAVLPPVLAALDEARARSGQTVAAEQESWSDATAGVETGAVAAEEPGGSSAEAVAVDLRDRRTRLIVAGLMHSATATSDR